MEVYSQIKDSSAFIGIVNSLNIEIPVLINTRQRPFHRKLFIYIIRQNDDRQCKNQEKTCE